MPPNYRVTELPNLVSSACCWLCLYCRVLLTNTSKSGCIFRRFLHLLVTSSGVFPAGRVSSISMSITAWWRCNLLLGHEQNQFSTTLIGLMPLDRPVLRVQIFPTNGTLVGETVLRGGRALRLFDSDNQPDSPHMVFWSHGAFVMPEKYIVSNLRLMYCVFEPFWSEHKVRYHF